MEKENLIKEEIDKFFNLINYDVEDGVKSINERKVRQPWQYTEETLTEAPGDEEEETEEVEGETEGGNEDFDFGDEGSPEESEETEEETEEETDEFDTASEFSAADDLEGEGEEVEEIDVTAIVNKSDEAKDLAQQAVNVGTENGQFLKSLTDKLSNLENQLSKMDNIASKINKLEKDVKSPEEQLELRSLDSYPFNMKLSDYWQEKSKDDRYRISTGEEVSDGQTKEYVLTPEELDNSYSEDEIKNTFNPTKGN
tara:strand:+ start:378 stop:1142 length:765 start_codon:yes stop_codon:yes gene_type:complete